MGAVPFYIGRSWTKTGLSLLLGKNVVYSQSNFKGVWR